MKKFIKTLAIGATALGFAVAGSAMAEDVKAEKTSGIKTLFPTLNLKFQTRYVATEEFKKTDAELRENAPSRYEFRPYINAKFLDDKLDTTLILGLIKRLGNGGGLLTPRQPELVTNYSIVSGDYLSVALTSDVLMPYQDKAFEGEIVPKVEGNLPIDTNAGKVTLALGYSAGTIIHGRAKDVDVVNNSSKTPSELSLTTPESKVEKDSLKVKQNHATLITNTWAGVSYEPSFVKGLSLIAEADYFNDFNPTPVVQEDGSIETVYVPNREVVNLLVVGYKISDTLSFGNEFYHSVNGFYESRRVKGDESHNGLPRYYNVTKLTYTMF